MFISTTCVTFQGDRAEQGDPVVISAIADNLVRSVESMQDTVSETFFEPVVRLGVTGLARSGKTVFITSLVANLGALTADPAHWPDSTRHISELRVSLRVRPKGLLAGLKGPRTVHIDIVDYPGEWLLDLTLMDKTYAEWSAATLKSIADREQAAAYRAKVAHVDGSAKLDEPMAQELAASFAAYLQDARRDGYSDCAPGRFLLPGDLAGSPVLTFAPLPAGAAPRGSLLREMDRRYEAYKAQVVKPFFRDHFARIDRQVVLVDALGAIHNGPAALEDLRGALTDILSAFRPGRNAFLTRLLCRDQGRPPAPQPTRATDRDHAGAGARCHRQGALCGR